MPADITEPTVTDWLCQAWNKQLDTGGYGFARAATQMAVADEAWRGQADIVLYEDAAMSIAGILVELKRPGLQEDLETLAKKTAALRVKYAVTWDLLEFSVWEPAAGGRIELHLHPQELFVCAALSELARGDVRVRLDDAAQKLLERLHNLYRQGTLEAVTPVAKYFANRLHRAVQELKPGVEKVVKQALLRQAGIINRWAVEQGISPAREDIAAVVAAHWTYKTIARIIFYLTVQENIAEQLPPLKVEAGAHASRVMRGAFEAAAQVDWQAVFLKDTLDEVLEDGLGLEPLKRLLVDLERYNFRHVAHDIMGDVYERLIPQEERHSLGQYFTPIDLVDLMLGFVLKNTEGVFCDPTCGTGTFLIRAYHRLRWLSNYRLHHSDLLPKLWGIDIANFPAMLATISLFRQDAKNFRNFPRIIREDMFEVAADKEYEFPPAKAPRGAFEKHKLPFPRLDGMFGNFPYIRQEQIERHHKGYKSKIARLIANEMRQDYLDIIKNTDDIHLSGQADIYAYMFFHVYPLLKVGARIAFVTSNAWLDTAYGEHLKRFFLRKFKIVAVVGSWAEPWFADAKVNTIFTVLERCDSVDRCFENYARFVRLKKPLKELLKYEDLELEGSERWSRIEALVRKIEFCEYLPDVKQFGDVGFFEDDEFSVRWLRQDVLVRRLEEGSRSDKWGLYIRAPAVYFELLEAAKDKLAPLGKVAKIRFGVKTGINEFFYLQEVLGKRPRKGTLYVRNARGWEGQIEKEYLKKAIKSPKEADTIQIDATKLKYYMFVCPRSIAELRRSGHYGAAAYIKWGEKQKTPKERKPWPKVQSVRGRKHWYAIADKKPGDLLLQMITNDRFVAFQNKEGQAYVDHNLFEVVKYHLPLDNLLAALNSTLFALFREVHSRVNLGDGATKTEGIDWVNMPVPRLSEDFAVPGAAHPGRWRRKIASISTETRNANRKRLDTAILSYLGLDAAYFLPRIYEAICTLVTERLAIAKQRGNKKKERGELSLEKVREALVSQLLPNGLRRFPDAFIATGDRRLFESLETTGQRLFVGDRMLTKQKVVDEAGTVIAEVRNEDLARFLIYQGGGATSILAPKEGERAAIIAARKAVDGYEAYIRGTRTVLLEKAMEWLQDASTAEHVADEILVEHGYRVPLRYGGF